jgi:hydrogenase large subunit
VSSSFYDDWHGSEVFVDKDPLGNAIDPRHPWNQTTLPKPQKRDFSGKYTWVMSPRWLDPKSGDHLALDTGGGPLARLWTTALAKRVDVGYVKATGNSVKIHLPKTVSKPEMELEWVIPKWSNTIERDRARTYFQAYAAAMAMYFLERSFAELHAGRTQTSVPFEIPKEGIGAGEKASALGDALVPELLALGQRSSGGGPGPRLWVAAGKREGLGWVIRAMGLDRRDAQPVHDRLFAALAEPGWLGFNPWERRW